MEEKNRTYKKNRKRGNVGVCLILLSHFLIFSFSHFLTSCDDYDSWTVSPKAQLTMSQDTIAFDTLITDRGSATKTLIMHNRNDKGLRISRVELALGAESPFHVNVDGQYLTNGAGEDFEVRRKDSIYVRVEVKLPAQDSDDIREWQDELLFTLESGTTQKVILTASGMDVVVLRGEIITADRTLDSPRPYVIYDSLVVAPGATLTLPQGATLMFHDGVSLLVHGTLQANGTLERPVVLRGDRTDRMFPYLPYDNTPNRWGGIHFFADSHDNQLTQCDIHSGDYGILCDSTAVTGEDTPPLLLMTDCVLHNIGGPGLVLTHCRTQVVGTQISNTLGRCVDIEGGAHTFVHCTIAQFYPLSAKRGDALYLANMEGDNLYRHIYWAHFINCVITGYADDVVMGNISENDQNPCDYLFANSLLRTVVSDDLERFRNIRYDLPDSLDVCGKDHFRLFDTYNFLYDFEPDSLSAIRSLADPEYAKLFPIDRRGVSRLADSAPDAGAYEGTTALKE